MIEDVFSFASQSISRTIGETVLHEGEEVWAVFGAEFASVLGGDARIGSTRPEITVALSDFAAPPQRGDLIVARGQTYSVATVQPDVEQVSVTLRLKRE